MKIGIAINGEGKGHFSRARALAEILGEKHDISFWVPEHLAKELARHFPSSKIFTIPYLKFIQRGFSLDYLRTISVNAALFLNPFPAQRKIVRELTCAGIEMVLSDFEPLVSAASKRIALPVLQLNHPGIVTRSFKFSFHSIAAQLVSFFMMSNSDRTILCSFFGGDVGPIIRRELRMKKITRGNYFVVYQKPLYRELLAPLLESLSLFDFRIFPDPEKDYAESLAGCRALIAPAGHQSISEALALGKPVFTIPVRGQFEQELNARKLRESGFGDYAYIDGLSAGLHAFFSSLEKYESAIDLHRRSPSLGKGTPWSCGDDTRKAVGMVENFISDSLTAPSWKRKAVLFPLLQG